MTDFKPVSMPGDSPEQAEENPAIPYGRVWINVFRSPKWSDTNCANCGAPPHPRCSQLGTLADDINGHYLQQGWDSCPRFTEAFPIPDNSKQDAIAHVSKVYPIPTRYKTARIMDGKGHGAIGAIYARAREEAHASIQDPGCDLLMLLKGPHGSGKTHLAAAIAAYMMEHGRTVAWLPINHFLARLRRSFDPESDFEEDELLTTAKRADLCILDDLGKQNRTPWSDATLFDFIDQRTGEGQGLLVTSNDGVPVCHGEDHARSILSRINAGAIHNFPSLDLRATNRRTA